jgi:hypothetical protein
MMAPMRRVEPLHAGLGGQTPDPPAWARWSRWRDSNAHPPRPERGAQPLSYISMLAPVMGIEPTSSDRQSDAVTRRLHGQRGRRTHCSRTYASATEPAFSRRLLVGMVGVEPT